jgi:hypothetical protein
MEKPSNSSPLQDQSRKSRTTNTKKMYPLVAVVICALYQVFQSTQVFVVLRAETPLDVPVERTDGAIVPAALQSASSVEVSVEPADATVVPATIPNASISRHHVIADLPVPASQSLVPARKVHANYSHAAFTAATLSHTNAGVNKTPSHSEEPPRRDAKGNSTMAFGVNVTKSDDSANSYRADVPTAAPVPTSTLSPNPDRVFWCGYNSLFGDSDFNLAKVLFPGVPARRFQYKMEFGPNDLLLKTQNGMCPTAEKGKWSPQIEDVFPGKILYVDGESSAGPPPTHERIYSMGPRADSNKTTRSYFGAMVLGLSGPETQKKIFDHQFRVKNTKKRFLSYIVSNCVEFRQKVFTDLSNIAPVHYGGRCSGLAGGNRTNIHKSKVGGRWKDNIHGVYQDYRFALIMENKKSNGYITEKMANAFLSGTVPIWYGTREVFDVFNERAFIYYDIKDPQPALDRIIYLEKNQTAYDEIQNEPILANGYQTIEDYFSFRDDVGGGKLKKRIRNMLGYE